MIPESNFCVHFKKWLIECMINIAHLDYTFGVKDDREGRVVALCFRVGRKQIYIYGKKEKRTILTGITTFNHTILLP